jgi:hypothetical protein
MRARNEATMLVLAALLAAVVVAAGCGGSGDDTATNATTQGAGAETTAPATSSTTGTDGQPALDPHIAAEQAITAFLTSPDSDEVCKTLISPALLAETYGDVSGCLNGRPAASLAKSVDVRGTNVDGDSVKATAVPAGGAYGGARLQFELTVSGRVAVIDALDANIPVGP